MNIRTKAALRTLAFFGGAFAIALSLVTIGYFFGEKVAVGVFLAAFVGFLAWTVYDHNVQQLEIEELFPNLKKKGD